MWSPAVKIPSELGRMSISPEEKRGGTPGSEIPKDVLHGLEFSGSGGFAWLSVMSGAVFSIHHHTPAHYRTLQETPSVCNVCCLLIAYVHFFL